MAGAYSTTEVAVERSQGAIRQLLAGAGASQFAFGEQVDADAAIALVEFAHAGLLVRIRVRHKTPAERVVQEKARRARARSAADIRAGLAEQEAKRIWRVIYHSLKARMVAVDEGVETFAQAFLPHLVNPATGRALYDELSDTGRVEWGGEQLALPRGDS